jgi:phosphoribosylanthranilate isomerase
MKIKICGIKYLDNLQAIQAMQPDYLGFIFYNKSPRYMGYDLLPSELTNVSPNIKKTGVFVNESIEKVIEMVELYALNAIQLHGDETVSYLKELLENLNVNGNGASVEIIKAFGVDEHFDFNKLNDYKQYCNYFLFDTKTPNYGGSGKKFQWNLLEQYQLEVPIFLSGGIDVEDLSDILNMNHPKIVAVDLNSKLEIEPGRKDLVKVKEAIESVKNYGN